MKRYIWILVALSVMTLSAEDKQPAKKGSAKRTAAAPAAELTLPAGAVQVDPGTYTYTDPKGKKWIYRQTPFGLSRAEADTSGAAASASSAPAAVSYLTATEDGDKVRFERPGPFGVYRWEKNKSELDDDERAALARSKAKQE
jgi:hypothetical protein